MSPENALLTPADREMLEHTMLVRDRLEEQYHDLEQQSHAAAAGMWVFLATEVMFFGTLFVSLGIYRFLYGEACEAASEKLNWAIGGINTIVLLISSFTMALAVHYARLERRKALTTCLLLTGLFGLCFMGLKAYEYYTDYVENLIPGWRFVSQEWVDQEGLSPDQVPHVKLFLLFYWIMTAFHALHVTIGLCAVAIIAVLARQGRFTRSYYAPVDVLGLYWHFVDLVWIFLLPMLYLLGTHSADSLHL
ncbi:MAG TPA: cytochrome c oxidase subunit 3 [Pirellulales bacterium]|nr:cytochrome c oxidase subunit 3 [Pirellulales bacterium]